MTRRGFGGSAYGITASLTVVLFIATVGEGGSRPTPLILQHLILLLLAVAIGWGAPHGARGLDPGVSLAFGGFLVAALCGALLAPYAFAAWLVLVELASFSTVLWLSARGGPGILAPLAGALVAWGALQSIAAIVERASGTSLRPHAGFLNPNHLAAWLVAVAFLGVGLVFRRGSKIRIAGGFVAIVMAAALILIGSRGVVAGVLAGGAVAVLLWPASSEPVPRRRAGAALAALIVIAVAGVGIRFRIGDPHGLARPQIWRASLVALFESPLTGTGPGQFETASVNLNFPRFDRPLHYEHAFSTPHSDLLRAPCEFGLPATLALLAAVALGVRCVAARRRAVGLSSSEVGGLAALAALAAQGAFNDFTETPGLYLLAAAIAGALVSVPSHPEPNPVPRLTRPVRVAVVLVVVMGFLVGDLAPYLSWRAARSLPRGALDRAGRAALETALRRNPFHPDLYLRRAEDRVAKFHLSVEDYAAQREDVEHAIRLNPGSAVGWSALAHVEGGACRDLFGDEATRERAKAAFTAAELRAAHDPFLPIDAARFLLATGDPRGARREAERALRLEPNAIPPRLLIAESLLAEGGSGAHAGASDRLAEAEALATRYAADANESAYAKRLLSLDPRVRARLRETLDASVSRD